MIVLTMEIAEIASGIVVDGRDSWRSLLLVETAGGKVVVDRDSWLIDAPVVQYFGLTGEVSMWSQVLMLVRSASHSWTRCCNAGADLLLMVVAWSCRIERVG